MPLCQRLKESSNYNKCSHYEKMSPITSHRECWVGAMLLFMCSRWTSLPIIQLSRTCLHFLNVCHQSVTAAISGNQCNSDQLKCDCEGGTSLYSIMGNKTAACFPSKRFLLHSVFLLFFPTSLYIGYLIQRKGRGGQLREAGLDEWRKMSRIKKKTLRLSKLKSLNCQGI